MRRNVDRPRPLEGWGRTDGGWLVLSLIVAGVVGVAYVSTHPHPAYEGGLYLQIVETILAEGYSYPTRIPSYTNGGVPFAYPPLIFYLVALIVDVTGIDPLTLMRILPAMVTMAALVPYYATARTILDSRTQAGIATIVFATAPAALRWHISAGGLVRAPAVFFTFVGLYAGVRLFRDGNSRWLPVGLLAFGSTVLTHPHYTAFFGLSYLVFFAMYDRSPEGLGRGAAVAVGGLLLAAPWWLTVTRNHGAETIFAAIGTHQGYGGVIERFAALFVRPLLSLDPAMPFYALALLGSLVMVWRRRYDLPVWLFVGTYAIGKARFLFVPGAMAGAALLSEALLGPDRRTVPLGNPKLRRVVVVGLLLVSATAVGAMFAGSALDLSHQHSDTQPQTVDSADRDAMAWARQNTDETATFVVLGDTAEWFPYLTDRTGAIGPWGLEWTSTDEYYRENQRFKSISTCDSATCLTAELADADRDPEYVYVPKGEYTVRGREYVQEPGMRASLVASDRYDLSYENEGVMIVAVRDG